MKANFYIILKNVLQGDLDVLVKKFVFKKISTMEILNYSKLHRYVNKARKLYHARYKCNNKQDPKIINLNKMAIPKKAYLLSFFSSHYHKIMKLKMLRRIQDLLNTTLIIILIMK